MYGWDTKMNPRIWGRLQHMDLKTIYAKLPIREFFQLRLVCKEWNRLASDRQFLGERFKDPIPKPYFILSGHGILAYEASSSRWSFTPLPPRQSSRTHLAIAGLIYRYDYTWPECNFTEQEVFNVHTKVSYKLPQPLERTSKLPLIGMAVDTSVSPYSFQTILKDHHTQIFDSKSNAWTKRQSKHSCTDGIHSVSWACVNRLVYIRSQVEAHYEIDDYNLERDEWGKVSLLLDPVNFKHAKIFNIGSWEGSLFGVTLDPADDSMIKLWKLVEHTEERVKWMAYDWISEDLFSWLIDGVDFRVPLEDQLGSVFCSEYLLFYTSPARQRAAQKFVMCNLASKGWERVQVPESFVNSPVFSDSDSPSSSY